MDIKSHKTNLSIHLAQDVKQDSVMHLQSHNVQIQQRQPFHPYQLSLQRWINGFSDCLCWWQTACKTCGYLHNPWLPGNPVPFRTVMVAGCAGLKGLHLSPVNVPTSCCWVPWHRCQCGGGAVESHGTGVSVEEVLKGLSGGGESGGGLAAGVPHRWVLSQSDSPSTVTWHIMITSLTHINTATLAAVNTATQMPDNIFPICVVVKVPCWWKLTV